MFAIALLLILCIVVELVEALFEVLPSIIIFFLAVAEVASPGLALGALLWNIVHHALALTLGAILSGAYFWLITRSDGTVADIYAIVRIVAVAGPLGIAPIYFAAKTSGDVGWRIFGGTLGAVAGLTVGYLIARKSHEAWQSLFD